MANIGKSLVRKAAITVDQPTGGAAGSAITVTGLVSPRGFTVETAWGAHPVNPPASGWGAATTNAATGAWSRSTTRPAAGTWFLHARLQRWPQTDVAANSIVVT